MKLSLVEREEPMGVEAAERVDIGNTEMLEHRRMLVGRSEDYPLAKKGGIAKEGGGGHS